MSGLPSINVVGTLTSDPELRFTPAGAAVANFTVASNERRLNKQTGSWEDGAATFLRCSVWRQAAENVAESLHRGDRVMVTGSLRQREYEKDGQKRTAFELDVDEVGPSLKWASAKVAKVSRSSDGGQAHGRSGSSSAGDDPWGSAPSGPTGGPDDEPPF